MLFNSFAYAVFLPVVFVLYWSLQKRPIKAQNALLLVASYVFYGWWDWRFLGLIVLSSTIDYLVGLRMPGADTPRSRKALLGLSLLVNIGLLGFFKYFGFFVDSFADLLTALGFQPNVRSLHIILPVGISFYTFQTLSYTIDLYRRKIEPTRDPIAFFAFVAFFPQLVAGPIERAKNLLPQFAAKRVFDTDKAKDGCRQILWGLFKKVVIADRLAVHVDTIYGGYEGLDGATLGLGTFFFAIQIYCDFSGYSDIAIGSARLFGFDLMRNFAFPYFSRDISEFWKRWHISLSTWFQDYVYIPLGGSRVPGARHLRNILITFVVSGFWHGANWTFIVWGFLHGIYYIPLIYARGAKKKAPIVAEGRMLPSIREFAQILGTFFLTWFAWIFFRAESLDHAMKFIIRMFSNPSLTWPREYSRAVVFVLLLLVVEWIQRTRQHGLQVAHLPVGVRWTIYYAVIALTIVFGKISHVPFIYFQF